MVSAFPLSLTKINHIFHLLFSPLPPPCFSFFFSLGSTSQRSPTGTKPKITLDPYIRLKSDKLDLVSPGYFRAIAAKHVFSWCVMHVWEYFIQAVGQNTPLSLSPEWLQQHV